MAVVNQGLMQFGQKDSRWLTLEVCREYQRNKCTRTETECKFAHPPAHVDVQNGRVVCCYDSIKAKCQRKEPPCKYLHPPHHLREQLLQNGRNNLIVKNIQMQMLSQSLAAGGQLIPVAPHFIGGTMPQAPAFGGFVGAGGLQLLPPADSPLLPPHQHQQHQHQQHQQVPPPAAGTPAPAGPKVDSSEVSSECIGSGAVPQAFAHVPGAKRPAVADAKSAAVPVYQPAAFQHLAAFHHMHSMQPPAYMPTSWTGELFPEAACPTLTWV